MGFDWEHEDYTGLSCPYCSSPNIEIDSGNVWFCYDCEKDFFTPMEE